MWTFFLDCFYFLNENRNKSSSWMSGKGRKRSDMLEVGKQKMRNIYFRGQRMNGWEQCTDRRRMRRWHRGSISGYSPILQMKQVKSKVRWLVHCRKKSHIQIFLNPVLPSPNGLPWHTWFPTLPLLWVKFLCLVCFLFPGLSWNFSNNPRSYHAEQHFYGN